MHVCLGANDYKLCLLMGPSAVSPIFCDSILVLLMLWRILQLFTFDTVENKETLNLEK